MMGGCVLRDAVGNVTIAAEAKMQGLRGIELFEQISDCNGTCRYGLQNDNQVVYSLIIKFMKAFFLHYLVELCVYCIVYTCIILYTRAVCTTLHSFSINNRL